MKSVNTPLPIRMDTNQVDGQVVRCSQAAFCPPRQVSSTAYPSATCTTERMPSTTIVIGISPITATGNTITEILQVSRHPASRFQAGNYVRLVVTLGASKFSVTRPAWRSNRGTFSSGSVQSQYSSKTVHLR
jgi:hypothetical protein